MQKDVILKPKYSKYPQSSTAWSLDQPFVDICTVNIQEQNNNNKSTEEMKTGFWILNS
jgi:hypothetical protein